MYRRGGKGASCGSEDMKPMVPSWDSGGAGRSEDAEVTFLRSFVRVWGQVRFYNEYMAGAGRAITHGLYTPGPI